MIWNRRRKGRWALSALRGESLPGSPGIVASFPAYTIGAIETDARVRCNHIPFLALQDESLYNRVIQVHEEEA
jgi:hypothetical protein